MTADVLIIGAGPAGAVAALRLAEAGFAVVVLEQGDRVDPGQYRGGRPDFEITSFRQWHPNPNVRRGTSDYPVGEDGSDIAPAMYSGVGGSTIIYAAQWPRALPSDLRVRTLDGVADDWPIAYRDLVPYYDRNDVAFGAAGLGGDPAYPPQSEPPLPPLPIGKLGLAAGRAMNRLGWHWWPATNAIASRPYAGRRPCVQRGTCLWGCPEGAKGSADVTHWPLAEAKGVRLLTRACVRELLTDHRGFVTGALYLDDDGREHVQKASVTMVAANAIGTPRLLLLSASGRHPAGLANSSGLVGKRLMMHPTSSIVAVTDEPLESWGGTWGSSIQSMQFYETDPARGFVRGAKWQFQPTGGPLFQAQSLLRQGRLGGIHEHVSRRLGRSISIDFVGEDLPEERNAVTLDPTLVDRFGTPAPRIEYRVGENSRRLVAFHEARVLEFCQELGAVEVDLDPLARQGSFHALGTARMGDNPETSVVDRWNRSHDVPNLYVIDGSVFVTSTGVNPTATIAAVALRAAERLVVNRRHQVTSG